MGYQLFEECLALLALEIEGHALFVGVEQEKIRRVPSGLFRDQGPPLVSPSGRFDLDDLGAKERQDLGARWSGLELREVEDLDVLQGFHTFLPFVKNVLAIFLSPRKGSDM